jgi:hypothetical protein
MQIFRFAFLLALLLAGCSTAREESRIAALVPLEATVTSFTACHGSNCATRTPVGLSDEQWGRIQDIFSRSASSAEVERRDIARAVAQFETFVGAQTGTMNDAARNRTDSNQESQLDCIDESVNTTTYLRLLDKANLLQWHDVAFPAHRHKGLIDFHNTAVIVEQANGMQWAVDSWFRPNAHEPYIVPLSAWLAGWEPDAAAVVTTAEPAPPAEPNDPTN